MKELYQNVLKTHYTKPIGYNRTIEATHIADGYNPTCGDEITIRIKVSEKDQSIQNIAFESDSCAICNASASILCQEILFKDTRALNHYYQYLTSKFENEDFSMVDSDIPKQLNSLVAVNAYPTRINCALLPWQVAIDAINSAKLNKKDSCSNV